MSRKDNRGSFVHYFPVYGCWSTGIIYAAIGVIAILSFLRIRKGGADESSLLAILNDHAAGKVLFWFILAGTVCYIIWRIFESIKDPYAYGKRLKGIALRSGIAMSTIPDALLALSAVRILLGTSNIRTDGRPVELRHMVSGWLHHNDGDVMTVAIGVTICISGLVQFFYGITRGYKERIDIGRSRGKIKRTTHFLAWIGYGARGVILNIIGFFFIKAGLTKSAEYVVNTDKAFDFVGDEVGHLYFILLAVGTIGYGLFMFILGWFYDPNKG